MTRSLPGVVLGRQEPRICLRPAGAVSSAAAEFAELGEQVGLTWDPWQRFAADVMLAETAGGLWAAFEAACLVSRQNGKGSVIEGIELGGLYLLNEQILHTSQLMATSRDAFRRVLEYINNTDWLRKRVKKIRTSNEDHSIELRNGARLDFGARSGRAGRGRQYDRVIYDEAMFLGPEEVAAQVPTMSTRPNPQINYFSSAGLAASEHLRTVRARALAGVSGLAYVEWSVPDPGSGREVDPLDEDGWAQANPALGIRISLEYIRNEQRVLRPQEFARERLGVFDDPPEVANRVIRPAAWADREDPSRRAPDGPIAVGVAAAWPDAESSAVVVAGRRGGEMVVQVIEHGRGTSWVTPMLRRLAELHNAPVVIDPGGPAGHLVAALEDPEDDGFPVEVVKPTMRQVGHASADFLAAVQGDAPALRHFDQPELNAAVAAAGRRTLGDLWTWQRRGETDISPLEAATLAAWQADREVPALEPVVAAGGSQFTQSETGDLARMGF